MLLWPYGLIMEEITWSMGQFIDTLPQSASSTMIFAAAKSEIGESLSPASYRAASYEYGPPRPDQTDRRR